MLYTSIKTSYNKIYSLILYLIKYIDVKNINFLDKYIIYVVILVASIIIHCISTEY